MLQDVSRGLERQNKMTKSIPSSRERWMKPRQQINKYVAAFTRACFHSRPLSQWPERWEGGETFIALAF